MPFSVEAILVDGGSEFKAEFEQACKDKGLILYELPAKRPQINGAVERCNAAWRYEFYAVFDLPTQVEQINPPSTASSTSTTTTGPTEHLADKLPQPISRHERKGTPSLICPEPGQALDRRGVLT